MNIPDDLLWVDVETTGLGGHGLLLEVGLALTTPDLGVITEAAVTVAHTQGRLSAAYSVADPAVQKMHERSGLWRECATSIAFEQHAAEQFLLDLIPRRYFELGPTVFIMCGSSVYTDRAWLAQEMPRLAGMFHYRNIDVSTLKELARRWRPDLPPVMPSPRGEHRALPDLHDSIAELAHYRRHLIAPGVMA